MTKTTTPQVLQLDLDTAQSAINEIELSLTDPNHILHRMFAEKRDIVRYLAECYEILVINEKLEIQTNQIANYLLKRVTKIDAAIGKSWVYDSLPAKYKFNRLTKQEFESSERTDNGSLNTPPDYEKENNNEIKFVEAQIALYKARISKLKTTHYLSKLDPEIYREHFIIRQAAHDMLSTVLDDRKTIPINTIHLLLMAYDMANLKHAAGEYISLLKKFGAEKKEQGLKTLKLFSSKQMGKILKGHVRELHQSMEIETQTDAYENGYYGKVPCPECGSWRINKEIHQNTSSPEEYFLILYCYKCGSTSDPPPVKLPLSTPTPQLIESL